MEKEIVISNLLIKYLQIGDTRSSQTIIFLHGWRSNKEVWRGTISNFKFQISNDCVFAIDLPAFGKSQMPAKPFILEDYCNVVTQFIEKMGLKHVVLVGHSFGGRVGIKLAAMRPELVGKLVLVDSAGFAMNESRKSIMAGAAKVVKPFFKPRFMQSLRRGIYKTIGAEDYVATPELQETFVNVVNEDLSTDMRKITCPTLIINGREDADTPVSFANKMQSYISHSELVILENAGHFSFLDQPEKFMSAVRAFVNSLKITERDI